jgi:cation-transporting ATPase E
MFINIKGRENMRHRKSSEVMPERPVIPRRNPDPHTGLTEEEVALRVQTGHINATVNPPSKSVGQIIRGNLFTFFNFVFFFLAACLVAVGSFQDMMFLVVAIANILIGIVQELRAKKVIDQLTLLSVPQVTAVRGGSEVVLAPEELVLDDVVVFSSGMQICADAVVLDGEVQVNESLITGEAKSITKRPGDALLSGSFVVAGKCWARLDKVGEDSYVSKLTIEAKRHGGKKKSEMMRSLDRLIQFVGVIIFPVGILLFLNEYKVLGISLKDSVVDTVAAMTGMIPEGLYLLTSVALAVSVIRLARYKTLVHEMGCIETLARVDVLCVDKTGTITESDMQVSGMEPLGGCAINSIREILANYYATMDADNATSAAMKSYFAPPAAAWHAERAIPFTSAKKWSAVCFAQHGNYVVGAPEFILKERYGEVREQVEPFSMKGSRVLLLAEYQGTPGEVLDPALAVPLSLVLIDNKIRENAPDTFRFFAEQGVDIKVISGDNPVTVSEVAKKAGIAGAENYVDASTLNTPEKLEAAVQNNTVFGRVTPDQKRMFVKALKNAGHTVAMTGDGVNDVLALKDADCSIAMASGSDAARQVSQLVLLDSDFAAMTKVVMEGRRVINNIQRAASLFLVKTIFSFFLSFITLFIAMPYPVTPIQLSLVSGLTIGAPAFFLALEPNKSLVSGHFLRNVIRKAFPGALTNLILILAVELYCTVFGFSGDELSTISAILLNVVGLLVLFQVCKPIDWKRGLIWGAMAVAVLVSITGLGEFFMLTRLSMQAFLILCLFLLLAYPVLHMLLRGFALWDRLVIFVRRVNPFHRKGKKEAH